jgi:bud emergence protein 1
MKSLRKSLNAGSSGKDSNRPRISTPLPSISKPPSAILPPQKVIRALASYRPQAPQELPFQKGDFFYVSRDLDNNGDWYEAHNPISGARGLVPRSMFEEFNKNKLPYVFLNHNYPFASESPLRLRTSMAGPGAFMSSPTPQAPKSQVFYAVVLHDFVAERADELDAKSGDSITVVAQSNREWFVAKPIGRLGRPGLIPVSFVEIHDPTTGKPIPNVNALMDRGDLPKVEDWKRAMFNYKQNSIALGVIDAPNRDSYSNSPLLAHDPPTVVQGPSPSQTNYPSTGLNVSDTHETLPEGILLSADVVSFHYEMEEYWFRIDAIFQPYSRPGQNKLPPAKQLILFRVYGDFYDFQVSLLDTFPREAGRQPPHARILPYMPGPAQEVDDTLTASRRAELDEYLRNLCDLNHSGAKYMLEHQVVRDFLSLKPGDVENETEARVDEMEALFVHQQSGPSDEARAEYGSEVRDALGRLRVQDDDEKSNDASEYEDEGYAPSPQRRAHDRDRHPYSRASDRQSNDSTLRLQAHAQNHQRTGSAASFHRTHSPHSSRSNSPLPRMERDSSPQSLNSDYYNQRSASTPSTSALRTSQAISSRSRSQSSAAASNLNTPAISAANPQTAFVKIKIFDRVADDLIAIRVHPRVTHAELMDKVQSRLGGEVVNLRYRDSVTNNFVGVNSDEDLRFWMDSTDKHVLYAD